MADWLGVRLVKGLLFLAIVFGLFSLWTSRAYVTEAYREQPAGEQITLRGVDLAITRSTIGQSPYVTPAAPDTRIEPVPALAFVEPEDGYPDVTMAGGSAQLSGLVVGPDGPVLGATVEIERHTTDGVAVRRLATGEAGEWATTNLLGGRYRVRAWLAGRLAMGGSEVIYLADDQAHGFEFNLWGIDPSPEMEFVANREMYLGVPATVAIAVTKPVIDDHGVVLTTPVVGAPVSVTAGDNAAVLSAGEQLTDADGVVRYVIACSSVTDALNQPGAIVARSGELVRQFTLPACVIPPIPEPIPDPGSEPAQAQTVPFVEPTDG